MSDKIGPIEWIRRRHLEETSQFIRGFRHYYEPHRRPFDCGTFQDLPLIRKSTVKENPESFICRSDLSVGTFFTGSTTGAPVPLYRSEEENCQVRDVVLRLTGTTTKSTKFAIRLESFNHGAPLDRLAFSEELTVPILHKAHFENAIDFICRGAPTPTGRRWPDQLIASALGIKALHTFAEENGRSFGRGLKSIVVYSSHLTNAWRKRIGRSSGAHVTTVFGLSEFVEGNAWTCPACSNLHFPPTVFIEIDGGGSVGELVLSSLYPYSQVQMFLRYATGDIVRRRTFCDAYGDYGYIFVGRAQHCRQDDLGNWVSPVAIAEALDELDVGDHADHPDVYQKISRRVVTNRIFDVISNPSGQYVLRVQDSRNSVPSEKLLELICLRTKELVGSPPPIVGAISEDIGSISAPFLY